MKAADVDPADAVADDATEQTVCADDAMAVGDDQQTGRALASCEGEERGSVAAAGPDGLPREDG